MKNFLINVLLSALAIGIAAYILPGVTVAGPLTAIVIAIVLAVINATVWRLLRVAAFPINVLTFGLIGFIISVLMILLTDSLVAGFEIANFRIAAIFALILAVIQSLFGVPAEHKGRVHV